MLNKVYIFVVLLICFVFNTNYSNATGLEDLLPSRSKSIALNEGGFIIKMALLSFTDSSLDVWDCPALDKEDALKSNIYKNTVFFKPAVYALMRQNRVVYIGETGCLMKRISDHFQEKKKEFDGFKILRHHAKKTQERKYYEELFIRKYKPFYNKTHSNKNTYFEIKPKQSRSEKAEKRRVRQSLIPKSHSPHMKKIYDEMKQMDEEFKNRLERD